MINQKDFKSHVSSVFTRSSTTYDQIGSPYFSYFGKKLVEFSAVPKGAKILDIACGKGAVMFPAAKAISESGEIIGIDISDGMIDQVKQEIQRRKLLNAKAILMDAENLELPDCHFDFVFCSLCLFYFPNMRKALLEFFRVLKPGGFIVASTFMKTQTASFSQEWTELNTSFSERIKQTPDASTSAMNSVKEIKSEITKAGFKSINIKTRQKKLYFQDENEWLQFKWSTGGRSYLERIPAELLPEYQRRGAKILQKHRTKKGIPVLRKLYFTKAQKPIN